MRIAIITHAFPPSRHANGKRPFYIAKGFLDAGWDVDVYTSRLGCDTAITESLKNEKLRVIRVSDPVVNWLERVKPIDLLFRLSVSITNGLIWPDFYAFWVRRVIKKLKKKPSYDRVLAFVFPASVYLCSKHGLVDKRWTFDLQESVTPQYDIVPRRSPVQRYLAPRLEKLEKDTLHKAGGVVFTAQTNRQTYISRGLVLEETTAHIPYFYDASVFENNEETVSEDFEICYFGTFDWRGSRSPEVFLKSLAKFLHQYPDARPKTRFVFYGMWLPEHDSIISELGLETVVDIKSSISYQAYLKRVCVAQVLLLVVSAEHNLFMPSKIVDYFGSKRPILAFVPRDSEMRNVLEDAGMADQAVDENDIESGAKAIASLWIRFNRKGTHDGETNTHKWSSEVQLPKYVNEVTTTN